MSSSHFQGLGDVLRRIKLPTTSSKASQTPHSDESDGARQETCLHGHAFWVTREGRKAVSLCPLCAEESVRERLYRASGVPDIYWPSGTEPATFDAFDVPLNPEMEDPFRLAREYCEDGAPPWMVLVGRAGNGKTHLAKAIAITFLERLALVRFWVVPAFLDQLRATFAPESTSDFAAEMQDLVYKPDLVVMDDYGAESSTPWANERLYLVLNMRYERRLRTVITCNEPEALQRADRIRSRLYDTSICQVVHCAGEDVRPKLRERRRK